MSETRDDAAAEPSAKPKTAEQLAHEDRVAGALWAHDLEKRAQARAVRRARSGLARFP